ncbi:MAG TPA: S1 RNA-binding domain-containing protein [Polyangiaceae bacterium]|nr:S1 RNA-binding domain-containing protein [Polyangiaceae bacterium]
MSTPDTPPQSPSPDDSAAHSPAPNESSPTGDSPGNGHAAAASPASPTEPEHAHAEAPSAASHGDEPPAGDESPAGDDEHEETGEAGGEAGEAGEGSTDTAGAAGAQPGEKKRRRRRRRKKGDKPAAGAEGATATPAEGEGAAVEGETAKPAERPEKREPRREKKSGPPRERPPVNAGDIVFGKILEIDDEAILIDIPGKARAIFDRREMLISDEDESHAQAAPREEPAEREEPELAAEATAAGEPPAESPPADDTTATAVAVPTETSADVSATTAEAPPAEPVVAEPAPREPVVAEPREPDAPREPKVPRVILEVGADFIGVVHNDGARGGLVVLTHHPKRLEKAKGLVEKASVERTTILGLVTGVIKGGIEVDVDGLRAFAPGSHVDLRLGADLSHLVAKRLPFYVTQYAKRGRDVVLSRRAMLEDESRKARSEALAKLKVGEEIEGIVRSVVPFGAFVDVGGVEGLVPLQEMSHNRGDGPSDVFKAGEPTRVVVTKIDDKGKIWLSHKATIPDPWQQVAQKYATGTRHAGKVVRLQPFGAFIELEPGVDGLLHTQDLSVKRIDTPEEVVKVGDAIEVTVAHVDPSNHKIALHPALQGDAANEAPQKVAPHKPVKAKIVAIESGGLVVRLLGVTGRNARGYVTSAGTGTPRGTELRKAFKVDQLIDAKVIEMDPRRGEVKLSIKALSEDQERSAYQQYRQQLKAEARFTFGDLLAKKGTPPR